MAPPRPAPPSANQIDVTAVSVAEPDREHQRGRDDREPGEDEQQRLAVHRTSVAAVRDEIATSPGASTDRRPRIIRAIAGPPIRPRPASVALGLVVVAAMAACSDTAATTPPPRSAAHARSEAPLPASPSASPAPVPLTVRPAGYRLSAPVQRAAAVAAPGTGSDVYVLGGLDEAGSSASGVFRLDVGSGRLSSVGVVPSPFHDAAAAELGGRILVFGGGAASGTDLVQSVDPGTGSASIVGHLPAALSDLTAATVTGPGSGVYLIGGWDGAAANRTIWRTTDGRRFSMAGHLPAGLRYAAAAAAGSTIVVAGGEVNDRPVATVYAFDTTTGRVRRLPDLPDPVGHAAAFSAGGVVYLLGGMDAAGAAVSTVTAVDPFAGTV